MRDNIWKYIALMLTLLLAASTVSAVLLYMQNSAVQTPPPRGGVIENSVNATCPTGSYEAQIHELQSEISMLKSTLRKENAPTGNATIAVVPIFGIIDSYTALNVIPTLREVAANKSINGVLLWIDSPGGEVGPVREIYEEVKKLDLIKPTVVYTGSIAASGGYYIATGADKIIADPLAEVGSIGVIYVHYDLQKNYQMNGIKVEVFKTGPHKDMGAEWRDLTPEEKKYIEDMVNTDFQAFLQAVSTGRNMSVEEVKKYATGQTWFAKDVNGTLVDDTGSMDHAIAVLANMLNVTNPRVVIYRGGSVSEFHVYGSTALFLDPRYLAPHVGTSNG